MGLSKWVNSISDDGLKGIKFAKNMSNDVPLSRSSLFEFTSFRLLFCFSDLSVDVALESVLSATLSSSSVRVSTSWFSLSLFPASGCSLSHGNWSFFLITDSLLDSSWFLCAAFASLASSESYDASPGWLNSSKCWTFFLQQLTGKMWKDFEHAHTKT